MIENRIGRRIHHYRKENSLTIREFAELSGISTALVSQLERGIGNPSLSVLKLICKTLGLPLSALFIEHERIHNPNEKNAVYFNLTPGPLKSNVELLMMVLGPNRETNHGFSQHFEEEIAFLLEGEADLVFEEEEFRLEPGDAVRILPSRKHKLRNDTARKVKVLFIKSKVNY